MTALLEVQNLSVAIARSGKTTGLVDNVSLTVNKGETIGLVGESGSGKSLTAFSIMGLFPNRDLAITQGRILLEGTDLRTLSAPELRAIRGARIGMVFQDPSAYLDPLMRVGHQVAEALRIHGHADGADHEATRLLAMVDLPDPAGIARRYPHELSGGQRQRVLIAAALAMRPSLLLADEPTTALDATVQAGILDLLARLQQELGLGILLISHDLALVAERCQRVAVMYAGRIVETGPAEALFRDPRHPYTQGLVRSTLVTDADARALFGIPGRVPAPKDMPKACRFHPRCPLAKPDPCVSKTPPLMPRGNGREDACWRADEYLDAWTDVAADAA
jgi:oligopeptide/dipeptide ABC transporter ATP-binding protein